MRNWMFRLTLFNFCINTLISLFRYVKIIVLPGDRTAGMYISPGTL
jgi:hypothetical protein